MQCMPILLSPCSNSCGMQVRSAATMGGNLALAKEQGLESDVATLMAALQAQVGMISVEKEDCRHASPCTAGFLGAAVQ